MPITKTRPAPLAGRTKKEVNTVEINGKPLTRENVRQWLASKRIVLWMDWMISEPKQMEQAIDWFIASVTEVAAA